MRKNVKQFGNEKAGYRWPLALLLYELLDD